MNNADIASKIQEDLEIYGGYWRAAPVFAVRRLMAEKGLRNVDIAERLGVSEANVSRMLRGDQNLKVETLNLLASAVQVSLNICFGNPVYEAEETEGSSQVREYFEIDSSGVGMTWGRVNALRGQISVNEDRFSCMEVGNEGSFAFR